MRVAIIARSTLYKVPGGDTVQATETSRQLNVMGISAEVKLADEAIVYSDYDLLHFFNIIRPADILYHSKKAAKPFVVSTIFVNYGEYDKHHRKGIGALIRYLPADGIEYVKTMARWLLGKDHLSSRDYIWKGQRRSIVELLQRAVMILPNSESEYKRVVRQYTYRAKYSVIPNGIDPEIFEQDHLIEKDRDLVLCVARIEGIKNQLNLIKALNNTRYKVILIGAHSPNQAAYYQECRNLAADNISFKAHMPQQELVNYYQQAKVHILPSWFETTGLSSVEAAVMGCNIVITDKGDTREYFEDHAFYCDPSSPPSILAAVEKASVAPFEKGLQQKILNQYTWAQAAAQTLKAYQSAVI